MTKQEIVERAKKLAWRIRTVDKNPNYPDDYKDPKESAVDFVFEILGEKR